MNLYQFCMNLCRTRNNSCHYRVSILCIIMSFIFMHNFIVRIVWFKISDCTVNMWRMTIILLCSDPRVRRAEDRPEREAAAGAAQLAPRRQGGQVPAPEDWRGQPHRQAHAGGLQLQEETLQAGEEGAQEAGEEGEGEGREGGREHGGQTLHR